MRPPGSTPTVASRPNTIPRSHDDHPRLQAPPAQAAQLQAVALLPVDVTVLSLVDGGECGTRTQVLACADALRAGGANVDLADAADDAAVDTVLAKSARLVLAADSDAQIRAVLRRATRALAPPPSRRPDGMPGDRTVPDLPPLAVLSLAQRPELVDQLRLPTTPEETAAAVLDGNVKRTDVMRHDGGGVTVHGVRIGGGDHPWRGTVALDDLVLADGSESIITCVVANAGGYASVEGLPLCEPAPDDGQLHVAVAVALGSRGWLRRRPRIEVRRARGRAVAVTPDVEVPHIDDGVVGTLSRKRTWWMERGAAGWFAPT